jgi:GNAT superfamily N-acetyltransferase
MYAIHRPDDRVAGMTEVAWSPARPGIVEQWGTGVWPAYRNRGLGRWLKAAMLTKILRELPEARLIRTGNANSNAPMLKINHELGFKPFMSRPDWQVETQTVEKYLAGSLQGA